MLKSINIGFCIYIIICTQSFANDNNDGISWGCPSKNRNFRSLNALVKFKGKSILDIGSGDGIAIKKLWDEYLKESGELVAVEPDENSYRMLKKNLSGINNILLLNDKIENLINYPEISNQKFDIITIFKFNIRLREDQKIIFFEFIKSLLKKNGILIISSVEKARYFPIQYQHSLYLDPTINAIFGGLQKMIVNHESENQFHGEKEGHFIITNREPR